MTDRDDEHVKDLLGRAFSEEPPLRIDRDGVIEQGRKRLRRKRFFEAGGVVAAVVVAAVGAATLTGLAGSEPDHLPPAASSSQPAPEGPQLPLTTTPIGPPPSAQTTTELPAMVVDPAQLTATLYATGVVSQKEVNSPPGRSGSPSFGKFRDRYVYEANVSRASGHGFLQVTVGTATDIGGGCKPSAPPLVDCTVKNRGNTGVVVSHFADGGGQLRTTAFTALPNGLRIYAVVTNTTVNDADTSVGAGNGSGGTPADGAPALSDEELCILVTKLGLHA